MEILEQKNKLYEFLNSVDGLKSRMEKIEEIVNLKNTPIETISSEKQREKRF